MTELEQGLFLMEDNLYKTVVKVDGLACGMCEGNIEDAILRAYPEAEKVEALHSAGEVHFLTNGIPEEKVLRRAIRQTGYDYVSHESTPYEKKGIFGRK